MTRGVGRSDGPDVLLIAEQLRRAIPGGIGTYLRGLLQGVRELGATSPSLGLVASWHPRPDPLESLGVPLQRRALPAQLLVRCWSAGLGPALGSPLVHAPSFLLPPGASKLSVTVHDLAFLHHPAAYPRHGRRWHERALERSLQRADAFVVPSAPVADQLVAAGADRAAVRVVEEGADHLPAPDESGAHRLLGGLGVVGEFFLTVGTLEPRKNLKALFEAYRVTRPSLPAPWPLVVVGSRGWKQAVNGQLPEGVHLAGKVDDRVLAALYRSARLFCAVPLEEGFCLPVAEAMHAGTPVVSSEVPAAGGATLLCDPASPDSIATALFRGATEEPLRAELVRLGAARSGELTWRSAAAAHLQLWSQLLQGEPR